MRFFAGQVVAVEGYLDVSALHQAGITTAVAALGTAITPQHAELMRRYTPNLVIAYDGDSAGVTAALLHGSLEAGPTAQGFSVRLWIPTNSQSVS